MNPYTILLAVLVPAIWGIQAVMLKFGISHFPPVFMVGMRFLIMSVILLPFISRIGRKWRGALLVGLSQGVLHFALLYIGFKHSDVTSGMIVYQSNTIFTLLLGGVILKERITLYGAIGTIICLAGVCLILGAPQEKTSILGLLIIATSAFSFACGNIVVRKYGPFDPVGLNAYVSLIAFPALFSISFITERGQIPSIFSASPAEWGALFYTALIGGVLAFVIWYRLLSKYSVDKISPYSLLMPFFSMVGSIILLNEKVTLFNYAGALITVFGIVVVQYGASFVKRFDTTDDKEGLAIETQS